MLLAKILLEILHRLTQQMKIWHLKLTMSLIKSHLIKEQEKENQVRAVRPMSEAQTT